MDCARCRMVAPANARFCPSCGPRLAFAGTRLADVSQVADTARGDGGGERKHVTVLFADTAASMDVLTRHDPEEAAEVFDHVLAQMTEAVHRYEGTVNQVLGDGIMAVFGAPVAHEDHAIRACYGALWMQES